MMSVFVRTKYYIWYLNRRSGCLFNSNKGSQRKDNSPSQEEISSVFNTADSLSRILLIVSFFFPFEMPRVMCQIYATIIAMCYPGFD